MRVWWGGSETMSILLATAAAAEPSVPSRMPFVELIRVLSRWTATTSRYLVTLQKPSAAPSGCCHETGSCPRYHAKAS